MSEILLLVLVFGAVGIYIATRKKKAPTAGGSDKPHNGDETNNQQ